MNLLTALRRRGRRENGFALVSVILLMIIMMGISYAMMSTSSRHTKAASLSRDFVLAGQMADYAVQDALAGINAATASKTVKSAPSSGTMPEDPASDDGGTWKWERTGNTVVATGSYHGTTRAVEAKLGQVDVTGYSANDGQVTYVLSMDKVFASTVTGSDVTVRSGYGVGSGKLIGGDISVLSGKAVIERDSMSSATFDGTANLYGNGSTLESKDGTQLHRNVTVSLDQSFATKNLNTCGPTQEWKASDHGGRLNAGSLAGGNNMGCYTSMDFDVPTNILGNGAFQAFVKGDVKISADITGAALNIFTDGSVAMKPESAAGSKLAVKNTFLYAPRGECTAARHSTKSLEFTGSIACAKVDVAGRFGTPSAGPFLPDASDMAPGTAPERTIWSLDEYQQPTGFRE